MGYFRKARAKLCEESRIFNMTKFSRFWLIPKDAEKLIDGRHRKSGDVDES